MLKKLDKIVPWIWAFLLSVLAWFYLVVLNSEVLYAASEHSLFMSGSEYLHECMSKPGGGLRWLGTWATQLFYTPKVGAAALIGVWFVTFYAIKRAFRISNAWSVVILIPLGCLLVSIVEVGYWLYYVKQPGYYFRESLGILAVALLVLIGRVSELEALSKRKWAAVAYDVAVALLIAVSYTMLGWYAFVAAFSLFCIHIGNRKYISAASAIAVVMFVPVLALNIYSAMRSEEAYIVGFPVFECNDYVNSLLSYPFAIAALSLVAFTFGKFVKLPEKKSVKYACCAVSVAIVAVMVYVVDLANFDDENFHTELRMYDATDKFDWERVLDEARVAKGNPTRQMVLLKNVALFENGTSADEMFHYNNMGMIPYLRDSLKVHMVQTVGPLLYLHHGKTNFAIRWCIENTVESGMTINDLKLLSVASLVSGEYVLADKYLSMLSRTMNYKEWAARYQAVTSGKVKIETCKELTNMRELYAHMGSILDGDQGNCEMYLINYFANTINMDSKYLNQLTLNYALLKVDIPIYWQHFFAYAELHKGEDMPIHYQEAAYLYSVLEPQTVDTSGMPFDKERIVARYDAFNRITQQYLSTGMSTEQVGASTESEFGDTFWWFYFFCRGLHVY